MAKIKLSKGPVWITGMVAILSVIVIAFVRGMENVVLAGLDALVWLIAIGLGANLLFATQRSAFYRKELDKPEEEG